MQKKGSFSELVVMTDGYQNAQRIVAVGTGALEGLRSDAEVLYAADPANAEAWLHDHALSAKTRVSVVFGDAWLAANPDAAQAIIDVATAHAHGARVRDITTTTKARAHACNFARNLRRASHTLDVDARGIPCAIVGGGPSLDDSIDALRRFRGLILAVNTALPALAHHGIKPHVGLCVESIPAPHTIEHADFPVLLALTAAPESWAAAKVPCAITDDEPCTMPYALRAGLLPLVHGGSGTTIALSYAMQAGCSEIVLVGQDHAYPVGHAYARHTAFPDIEVAPADGVLRFTGTSKRMAPADLVSVPAWGGTGTVPSTLVWRVYRDHIARAAQRIPIVNTSHMGARIDGTREVILADYVAAQDVPRDPVLNRRALDTVDALREMVSDVTLAAHYLHAGDAHGATMACAALNLYAVPHMIERQPRRLRAQRDEDLAGALRVGVDELLAALAG